LPRLCSLATTGESNRNVDTQIQPKCGHTNPNAMRTHKPLPGLGWGNNSLFSFWGSPFSRPASVQYDSKTWTNKVRRCEM
jgi:hypothetical protein